MVAWSSLKPSIAPLCLSGNSWFGFCVSRICNIVLMICQHCSARLFDCIILLHCTPVLSERSRGRIVHFQTIMRGWIVGRSARAIELHCLINRTTS